jgi:thioesterase domain-containing protein/acyl carrier protein
LGVERVGVRDDFFELGGHSLVAVELVNRVADEFHCSIPLAELLRGRTIETLAFLIEDTTQDDWSPLVVLQPKGALPPVFLIHPAGGNVLCYQPLAASLGNSQPVYAIQARGVEEGQAPHTDLHEMLPDYAAVIDSVYPEGPVFLAGWSLGGVLAYHLAGTLKSLHRDVALLALLDSYHPSLLDVDVDDEVLILGEFIDSCRQLLVDLPEFDRSALVNLSPSERLEHVVSYFSRSAAMPLRIDVKTLENFLTVAKANLQAGIVIPPAINETPNDGSPVEVHLFRPSERGTSPISNILDRGWGPPVEDQLVIHEVDGNHWTMLSGANAATLAAVIKDAIAKSLQSGRCQTEIGSM